MNDALLNSAAFNAAGRSSVVGAVVLIPIYAFVRAVGSVVRRSPVSAASEAKVWARGSLTVRGVVVAAGSASVAAMARAVRRASVAAQGRAQFSAKSRVYRALMAEVVAVGRVVRRRAAEASAAAVVDVTARVVRRAPQELGATADVETLGGRVYPRRLINEPSLALALAGVTSRATMVRRGAAFMCAEARIDSAGAIYMRSPVSLEAKASVCGNATVAFVPHYDKRAPLERQYVVPSEVKTFKVT